MALKVGFSKVRNLVISIFILVATFSGGYILGHSGFKAEVNRSLKVKIDRQVPPEKDVDFGLFWQVWDTLSANYFDKTKLVPADMVYGAIGGMVSALGDPYTMFLPPKENKIVDEDLSGKFEGVGIQIGFKDSKLAVISPLEGSPAEKAGLKAGDYIVRITDSEKNIDINTSGIALPVAVQSIRGPAGSKVTLTLVRDGNPKPIVAEIVREKLNFPSVTLTYVGKDSDIARIRLAKFDADTVSEWDKAVNELITKGNIKGVILDLRNNPGGYLQTAVDIAGDFMPSGSLVVTEAKGDGSKVEYKTEKLPRLEKYKLVVLINEGSASASEILSGSLRDQKGVKLFGEKSFGKGTVQIPLEIPGGSGLHVTVAKWLTPAGTWVHGDGLEPDKTITIKEEDTKDVQLEGAIEYFQ